MKFITEKFWAGTEASFEVVLAAEAKVADMLAAGKTLDESGLPPLLTVEGSVGVIDISGSLINGEAGFWRYFGVTGYADIRQALVDAVSDKNVKSILLNISSGGGQVAGVMELGQFISSVDAVKPVYTFSENVMASAAYWLGVSARKVYAGATSIVGSVGVLQIHAENSKQMEDNGVKVTVIRSGKYKAIANRYEPLSDLAQAELQSQVDDLYQQFIEHVADSRGVDVKTADKQMGQGREFLGKRALDAGLIDGVMSFTDAFSEVASAKSTDSIAKPARSAVASNGAASNNPNHLAEGQPMKRNLTAEQLAALAAGATPESLGLSAADLADPEPTAEDKAKAEAEAAAEADAKAKAEAEDKAKAEAEAAAASNAQPDSVVAFLRTELKDTRAELVVAQAAATTANEKLAAMETVHESLLAIARDSLGKMQIALGGAAPSATLSATEVLAEHKRVSETFKAKFKVGGVAATKPEEPKPAAKATSNVDPLFLAAAAAASKALNSAQKV